MFGRSYGYYDPYDLLSDVLGGGRSRYTFDGDVDRRGFASVSQRALGEFERAKGIFLKHLASVDTSNGPVTEEIIKFHLVGDMKTKFNKLVREHGCVPSQRKLTRAEQDLVNKTRKSLMSYSSVKVTAEAQKAYLAKNPKAQPKGATTEAGPSTAAKEPLQNNNGKRARDDDASVASGSVGKKAKTT